MCVDLLTNESDVMDTFQSMPFVIKSNQITFVSNRQTGAKKEMRIQQQLDSLQIIILQILIFSIQKHKQLMNTYVGQQVSR